MLTFTGSGWRLCDGVSRRDVLRVGALGIGGLTLADLLRLRAQGAAQRTGRSVIMVYLNGRPSHLDLYDPKPDAPVEYRGELRAITTKVPGMRLGELLTLQASIADRFAIVR